MSTRRLRVLENPGVLLLETVEDIAKTQSPKVVQVDLNHRVARLAYSNSSHLIKYFLRELQTIEQHRWEISLQHSQSGFETSFIKFYT